MIWRHLFLNSRRSRTVLTLTVLYIIVSVIYYHLPWKIRFPIYQKAPQLNSVLSKSGFAVMKGWDQLALFGKDAKAEVDGGGRGDWVYGGFPKQEGFKLIGRTKRLDNRGYVVGYSDSKKNPLWVSYRLFDVPKLEYGKRVSFKVDSRTKAEVRQDDYTHSGYDRGHMAPNYGIGTRYGYEAQKETFRMSNIIPQKPAINRHMWKDLEMTVAKRYGRYFSEVWVITGPVFEDPIEKLDSGVPIPSHYYKIIADEKDGELRVLAFLIENDCPPYTRIRKRLVSVDRIETLTGLDFFPDLPETVQLQLESDPAGRLWPWIRPMLRYHVRGKTN